MKHLLISAIAAALSFTANAADVPRGSDLSGPWQLFVDDYLVEQSEGVARSYHAFEKHPANPIQGITKYGGRGSVLPAEDGAGYRLWSSGGRKRYVSNDGLSWEQPVRSVMQPEAGDDHGCCSVISTPWDPDPDRRFKMWTMAYANRLKQGKLSKGGAWFGWVSPDGIHWTAAKTSPLFLDRSDVGKFGWDAHRQQYFGTPKIFSEVRGHLRRCIGFSASKEFDAPWPTSQLMLVPDHLDDAWAAQPGQHTQFYSLSAFAYETMYAGFLEVFRVTDGINDGPLYCELVTSRDGIHWNRLPAPRLPILAVGPPGTWDGGMLKVPSQPLVEGDKIKLFYGANNKTHGFGRSYNGTADRADERETGTGLATLRKDGFASLNAGAKIGTITTIPLANARGPLAVNYRAHDGGSLRVEVLDERGRVVPGYSRDDCEPLAGDNINEAVRWGQVSALPAGGKPVRLRFVLRNASLYSFNAGDSVRVQRSRPELAVLHTFEGAKSADGLLADGAQALFFKNEVAVDSDAGRAAFGSGSAAFSGTNEEPWDTLELENTFRLGASFTLSAMVKPAATGRMRLFSAWEPYPVRINEPPHQRNGEFGTKELILDFDATAPDVPGRVRLVVNGKETIAQGRVSPGQYHHLAATYDNGLVTLYLDGKLVGQGRVPNGDVTLQANLRVGEDLGPLDTRASGITTGEQLIGNVDDLLVLGRALGSDDIRAVAKRGAAAFFRLNP